MAENQFDELFKNKLRDHQSSVPEDMWERIVQKKEKRRRGLFFWWLGLGLLTIGLGTYFLFKNKSYPDQSKINETKSKNYLNTDSIAGENKLSTGGNNLTLENSLADSTTDKQGNKYGNKNQQTNHKPSAGDKGNTVLYRSKKGQSLMILQNNWASGNPTSLKKKKSSPGGFPKSSQPPGFDNSEKQLHGASKTQTGTTAAVSDQQNADSNHTIVLGNDSVKDAANKTPLHDSTQDSNPKKAMANKIKKEDKWWLDLYLSPDLPITYHNEPTDLSFTAGIKINRAFGQHFSAATGIQFSQINFNSFDNLKSLDLPLLASYSFGNMKFKLALNAGLIVNLYSWAKEDSLSAIMKTNSGLSLYGGISFAWPINKNISVFGEPYFRYRLNSITNSSLEYYRYVDGVGILLGIKYYFKR